MSEQHKGCLIVIDGGDGSGKTEQTKLLVERLKKEGAPVETLSFPRYETPTGALVKAYLDGKLGDPTKVPGREASILYAYDRWAAYKDGAFDALKDGAFLIANRYVASNMGHQGSKFADSESRMNFFKWNDTLEHEFFGIPRPNINVILHVPPEVSMKLIEKRGETMDGHENLAHLKQAEATYLEMAATFPNFVLIECVDAEGNLKTIPEIHELIWAKVGHLCSVIE